MRTRLAYLIVVVLLTAAFSAAAQSSGYVDVKETNKKITSLQTANENHRPIMADNRERKGFLEERISSSESRLREIGESLEYTRQANLELNALYSETRDRETKRKLEASRAELLSVIWILKNERVFLQDQLEKDAEEIEFLTRDTDRRESLIVKNEEEVLRLQRAVTDTETKIGEISGKIDAVISRLDGLRDNVTVDAVP